GWLATIKHSSVSIENSGYDGYADLRRRVLQLVSAVEEIIESDVWTRVGLRYINAIDVHGDPAEGWVNDALVGPLQSDAFAVVSDYSGRIASAVDGGGCLLQHGLRFNEDQSGAENQYMTYVFDFDVYRNEVAVQDTAAALDDIHAQAFNLFDWCLGPKAREQLSATK
ncbi:TIGR04255 family protein, partial [Luteimonas sp. FCS-9]